MTAVVGPASASETTTFGHLTIQFDDRVLRPRGWTAQQSTWASELLVETPEGPVLEICAGVGHIGLLAVAGTLRELVLVDLNPVACHYARINANAAGHPVEVREGPMDEVVRDSETYALIIADPPWVPSDRTAQFPEDPLIAIDGGSDGMGLAWTCVEVVAGHLADGGSALLQLGDLEQVDQLERHLADDPDLGLRVLEVREHDGRGVVVRLVRA
ncbi:MAG: methyltransferase small [Aeromicrobium sp.]|jgi:methylase of polypeptide subunit release factors|nr:methyltransferase small [Aeromicrobium sp.]